MRQEGGRVPVFQWEECVCGGLCGLCVHIKYRRCMQNFPFFTYGIKCFPVYTSLHGLEQEKQKLEIQKQVQRMVLGYKEQNGHAIKVRHLFECVAVIQLAKNNTEFQIFERFVEIYALT